MLSADKSTPGELTYLARWDELLPPANGAGPAAGGRFSNSLLHEELEKCFGRLRRTLFHHPMAALRNAAT